MIGFMLTSCGGSVKENIMKDVDNYFTEAEQQLAAIDNVEDFLTLVELNNDRSDLQELLENKYGEKEMSEEDWDEILNYINDRATAYNQAEAEKTAEYLTPAIDRLEAIVNEMYPVYQAGTPFDADMLDEYVGAYMGVSDFDICENVYPELTDRLNPLLEKDEEMEEAVLARLDELYPDE